MFKRLLSSVITVDFFEIMQCFSCCFFHFSLDTKPSLYRWIIFPWKKRETIDTLNHCNQRTNYNVLKIWFLRIDMSKNHGKMCAKLNLNKQSIYVYITNASKGNKHCATAMHLANEKPWCESSNQSQCNELRCKKKYMKKQPKNVRDQNQNVKMTGRMHVMLCTSRNNQHLYRFEWKKKNACARCD